MQNTDHFQYAGGGVQLLRRCCSHRLRVSAGSGAANPLSAALQLQVLRVRTCCGSDLALRHFCQLCCGLQVLKMGGITPARRYSDGSCGLHGGDMQFYGSSWGLPDPI